MRDLLPDEWRTATRTLKAMNLVAGPIAHSYPRSLVAFAIPFLGGALPSFVFMRPLATSTDSQIPLGIMAALLAFGGLLVGFVVTLMLFTGRLEDAKRLTYEQAVAFAERLKYLLASQAMTLFAALLLSLLTVAWMILYGVKAPMVSMFVVGTVLFGFAGVCLVRVFLLPMQIYELHEESLDAAVEMKEQETNARYEGSGQSRDGDH